jgi:hypothetical protein
VDEQKHRGNSNRCAGGVACARAPPNAAVNAGDRDGAAPHRHECGGRARQASERQGPLLRFDALVPKPSKMGFVLDDVDLAALARTLRELFATAPPAGYLEGRTALRDAVALHLSCSMVEAEELVDTLEAQGYLHFEGDPTQPETGNEVWSIVER